MAAIIATMAAAAPRPSHRPRWPLDDLAGGNGAKDGAGGDAVTMGTAIDLVESDPCCTRSNA